LNYRIVAVDDGSNDETGKILKKLSEKYPITLVTHKTNLGLAAALRDGINAALQQASDGDFIITMDADNTHDPSYIIKMVHYLDKGAEIIIASRYIAGGRQIKVPPYRVALSRCANLFLKLITGVPVNDVTGGYRAFKASVLKKAVQQFRNEFVTSRGFEATVEILTKTYWHGGNNLRISEMPFLLDYSVKKGKSKMKIFNTVRLYLSMVRKMKEWRTKLA
jgi:dolichol-phosphate mannosyltransferase